MSLLKYVIRRLIITIPIMFGVLLFSFVLTRAMPGNPYLVTLPQHLTSSILSQYEANVARLGLNKPIMVQFIYWKLGDFNIG